MLKKYRLKNLGCANCAAKMEEKIKSIPGVKDCSISFMTTRMKLELEKDNIEELLPLIEDAIHFYEPYCDIA